MIPGFTSNLLRRTFPGDNSADMRAVLGLSHLSSACRPFTFVFLVSPSIHKGLLAEHDKEAYDKYKSAAWRSLLIPECSPFASASRTYRRFSCTNSPSQTRLGRHLGQNSLGEFVASPEQASSSTETVPEDLALKMLKQICILSLERAWRCQDIGG